MKNGNIIKQQKNHPAVLVLGVVLIMTIHIEINHLMELKWAFYVSF